MASQTANFCIDARDRRAQVAWRAKVLDDFEPAEADEGDGAELRGQSAAG